MEHIYNISFLPCSNELAVVKLSIIGLVDYKSDMLLRILENWANTSSTVVLEGLTLPVVKACREFECLSRILSSSSAGVISNSPTDAAITQNTAITIPWMLSTLVLGSFFCIAGIILLTCIVILFMKKRKKSRSTQRYYLHRKKKSRFKNLLCFFRKKQKTITSNSSNCEDEDNISYTSVLQAVHLNNYGEPPEADRETQTQSSNTAEDPSLYEALH